ncbi:hypothetical protein [Sansalvadorimonas verongulae]|uniref:hypothetical protein n=1 Tax=Sansalvadorimonas verongulae TaxID=2172824 RepID=UPI0012BBCC8A|nr:hypothetical protein [Sansalvadorimonas verongulae]
MPALLILPLTNGHLMVSRVNRSDIHTLPTLNTWYPRFFEALALLQKGNIDYVAGRGVVALHRDFGEPWQEHQPRFYKRSEDMARSAREQNISRLFWHGLAIEQPEKSQPNGQPPESTRLTFSKGWKELWLTR